MPYTDELICEKLDCIIDLLNKLYRDLNTHQKPASGTFSSFHGDKDVLLSTEQAAQMLGMTKRFLESKRMTGGGPAFVKLSGRAVRYKESALRQWSDSHTVANTSEVFAVSTSSTRESSRNG